ncbi:hypothetical protein SAMN05444673_6849 [Bacillus sp. OV166]|uniref:hypothetical protein n=1 Tax=Bacillus sp. OV166 TaxID=1882763 RepID=UPI000A2AC163|nr:hypothetical protein [Bacillus sp. OV166]SMQ86801.1 hypothetical protein SAMN05444673_6849 [Bacillus sp. OV166]
METSFHGLKVAKSSTGYFVGRFFQEDEASTKFVRLTDDLSSKQEAIQWIEAIYGRWSRKERGVALSRLKVKIH